MRRFVDSSFQPDAPYQILKSRVAVQTVELRSQQQIEAMLREGKTRAQVLRDLIDIPELVRREYNPSFVLMQYFGYLRRNPDRDGYNFWLNVLETQAPENYRGMVCAFITSAEYQRRFSSALTHTNAECQQ